MIYATTAAVLPLTTLVPYELFENAFEGFVVLFILGAIVVWGLSKIF